MQHLFRVARAFATLTFLAAIVASATGCTPKSPAFVENGSAYTTATVSAVYGRADVTKLAKRPTTDAPALRHAALSHLRARGGNAATIADLFTKTLQAETTAVPVYVEVGTFSGKPAIILVEAAGPKSGMLDRQRLWVFDEHGNVVFAGSH